MANNNERSLKMLSTALEMEEKGKAFYDKAVATCKNPLGVEIFKTLRNDELIHVERIKSIYASLDAGKTWNEDWARLKPEHSGLTPLFRDLTAKHGANIKVDTSDIDALDVGIDFESKSVHFYESHLSQTTDPHERIFLEKMVEEEKGHHSVLSDLKYYLTDPADWFAERERSGYDGA